MNQNRNPYQGQYPYQNPNQNAYPEQYDDYQQPAYQNDGYQEQPAYPVQNDYQQTAYQNDGYQEQTAYPVQDDYQQTAYQNDGYQEQSAYPVQNDYQQPAYQNDGYQEQPAYPVQDNYQQTAYQNDGYQEQPAYPVQDDYQQPTYPTRPAPRRRPRTVPQRNWSAESEHSVQQARPAQRNWSAESEQPVQQARSAQRNWSAEPEQPVQQARPAQRNWSAKPEQSVQQARPAQRNWSAEPEHSEPSAPSAPSVTTVSSADTVQEQTTIPPKITGEIVISAKNIHKTFGKGETAQVVLDGANLDIEKGSFVSLMGESGTGKSTLLYLIGGLDRDFTGDIFVSGKNIANLSDNQLSEIRCKKMGFVFQFYNLAANLTIEDNILLPLEMSGRKMADYREKYKEILEITGLENKVKSYPSQLSGGQQQRAAIARAVLGDPEIILADEPTGNLDAASGAEIMELFSRLNKERGVTILQVTHSAEAASYSSRIVTLKNRIITG